MYYPLKKLGKMSHTIHFRYVFPAHLLLSPLPSFVPFGSTTIGKLDDEHRHHLHQDKSLFTNTYSSPPPQIRLHHHMSVSTITDL